MPVHTGKDKEGSYYRWGTSGKKFHFDPSSESSKSNAKSKAQKQARAIYASGYRGDLKMAIKLVSVKRVKKADAPNQYNEFLGVIMKLNEALRSYYEGWAEFLTPEEAKKLLANVLVAKNKIPRVTAGLNNLQRELEQKAKEK